MSWQCTLSNAVMRLSKWYMHGKDFTAAKAAMIKMADKPAEKAPFPDGATVEKVQFSNVNCEWVYDASLTEEQKQQVILYFHGGGFFAGSPATHRDAAHRLSVSARMRTLLVDYSLTPEHVFPVALNQAVSVYQQLLSSGISANKIAFGGDSAGGNMTLAVMKQLQHQGIELPFAGFCISPWADLTHSGHSWQRNRYKEAMIPQALLKNAALVYASGEPLDNPLISPVFADLQDFPPLYVIAGGTEILVDDANRIEQQAQRCGVKVEKKIWAKAPHAFTTMASFLPEGREAINDIGNFLTTTQSSALKAAE